MKLQSTILRFVLLVGVLIFAGCVTTPVATTDARDVPSNRIVSSIYSAPAPETGILIIKRDRGFVGSACNSRVSLDGVPIADIDVGEKIELYPPVGEYIVGSKPRGICGIISGRSEVSVVIHEDRPTVLRIRIGYDGYSIQPTAF
jgi:hypothetical protein